ncbi:MAG: hemolysin III family protein, partial [Firmicutes bacterium]|nr:hemolysin III family protein [Bacillota bacterium]
FNMISHIVGGAIGVAALVLCIIFSAIHQNGYGLAGSIVFGVSMITLYTMSSIYHGLKPEMAKKVFQVIDHCTIYLLIAGTYTPVMLSAMRPVYPAIAWTIFGVIWACAIVAVVLTAIDLKKYKVFSMICYLGMGWCIIFFIKQTAQVLGPTGTLLLALGGVAYTIGAVLYGLGKKKAYIHSVFHIFCIIGSLLHYFMILFYVMPIR